MSTEELLRHQQMYNDPQAAGATTGHDHSKHTTAPSTSKALSAESMAAASIDPPYTLQPLATNVGGRWSRLSTLPAGANAYHAIMGPGGKILLIAGSATTPTYLRQARSNRIYGARPKALSKR